MNRWEYNEEHDYWGCYLEEKDGHKKHRIVVQSLTKCYCFRFYIENRDCPEIEEYFKAENIEEAIMFATKYVVKYAKNRANYFNNQVIYWNKLASLSEARIGEMEN